jgi:hypothetical protein
MVPLKKNTTDKALSFRRQEFFQKQLLKESAMVVDGSLKVLEEFETFKEDLPFNGFKRLLNVRKGGRKDVPK